MANKNKTQVLINWKDHLMNTDSPENIPKNSFNISKKRRHFSPEDNEKGFTQS